MTNTPITIICDYCGEETIKTLAKVADANRHNRKLYCDNSCSSKQRHKFRRDTYVAPLEKCCRSCGCTKLLNQFYVMKTSLDGKDSYCKSCRCRYASRWHKKRRYGVSPEQESEMLESQDDVCAICGCDPPLCIDHCHDTNKFRGLLCRKCNAGLGFLGDNLEGLLKAITYLERFNANND